MHASSSKTASKAGGDGESPTAEAIKDIVRKHGPEVGHGVTKHILGRILREVYLPNPELASYVRDALTSRGLKFSKGAQDALRAWEKSARDGTASKNKHEQRIVVDGVHGFKTDYPDYRNRSPTYYFFSRDICVGRPSPGDMQITVQKVPIPDGKSFVYDLRTPKSWTQCPLDAFSHVLGVVAKKVVDPSYTDAKFLQRVDQPLPSHDPATTVTLPPAPPADGTPAIPATARTVRFPENSRDWTTEKILAFAWALRDNPCVKHMVFRDFHFDWPIMALLAAHLPPTVKSVSGQSSVDLDFYPGHSAELTRTDGSMVTFHITRDVDDTENSTPAVCRDAHGSAESDLPQHVVGSEPATARGGKRPLVTETDTAPKRQKKAEGAVFVYIGCTPHLGAVCVSAKQGEALKETLVRMTQE